MPREPRRFPPLPRPTRPMSQDEVMDIIVPELTRRIVALAHPLRIILFGSAARGEMGPDSDLDVLVVMPEDTSHKETLDTLYRELRIGFAKDILVITEGELAECGDDPWMVYREALREGKGLYRRES